MLFICIGRRRQIKVNIFPCQLDDSCDGDFVWDEIFFVNHNIINWICEIKSFLHECDSPSPPLQLSTHTLSCLTHYISLYRCELGKYSRKWIRWKIYVFLFPWLCWDEKKTRWNFILVSRPFTPHNLLSLWFDFLFFFFAPHTTRRKTLALVEQFDENFKRFPSTYTFLMTRENAPNAYIYFHFTHKRLEFYRLERRWKVCENTNQVDCCFSVKFMLKIEFHHARETHTIFHSDFFPTCCCCMSVSLYFVHFSRSMHSEEIFEGEFSFTFSFTSWTYWVSSHNIYFMLLKLKIYTKYWTTWNSNFYDLSLHFFCVFLEINFPSHTKIFSKHRIYAFSYTQHNYTKYHIHIETHTHTHNTT